MKNKKGSHVGIVLSFVIFVSFVVFIYFFIQPAIVSENKENLLRHIKDRIIEEASAEVTSMIVGVSSPDDCIQINNFFENDGFSKNLIATNSEGESLIMNTNGVHLRIDNEGASLLKIYESEAFDLIIPGSPCTKTGSSVSLLKTDKEIFKSKILEIIGKYDSDYDGLTEDLGLPAGSGFGITFTDSSDGVDSTGESEIQGISLYQEEYTIQYLSDERGIELGKLNVKVW